MGRRFDPAEDYLRAFYLLRERQWEDESMKPKPGGKPDKGKTDLNELLLKVIDVQSRCIEALAVAVGASSEATEDKDEDEDEDEEGEEEDKE